MLTLKLSLQQKFIILTSLLSVYNFEEIDEVNIVIRIQLQHNPHRFLIFVRICL